MKTFDMKQLLYNTEYSDIECESIPWEISIVFYKINEYVAISERSVSH